MSSESALPATWSARDNVAWSATLGGLGSSSPITWGEQVFVTSQTGRARLREGSHPMLARDDANLVARERPIGGVREGGEPCMWQMRLDGVFFASPVAADGKVYFASQTGETVVVKAGREPAILARNDLGERLVASPAIAGGLILLRSDARLFAIGRRSAGQER